MKILRVVAVGSQTGKYGGPFVTALEQSALLRQAGHDVELFAGSFRGDEPAPQQHLTVVPVRHLFGLRSFVDVGSVRAFRSLISGIRTSGVVHVSFAREILPSIAALAALAYRKTLVLQPHGMLTTSERRFPHRVLDALLIRPLMRRASRIVALTEREKEQLEAWAPKLQGKLDAIGNPPPPLAVTMPPLSDDRKGEARFADALFAARLHPRKRVIDFAEAARFAEEKGWPEQYVVLGPDEGDLRVVETIAASVSTLRYAGATDNAGVLERLALSRVFVLTSSNEPWGNVLVAALSLGKPVVVTASSALAETIKVFGAGLIVGDNDPVALATAVHAVLDSANYGRFSRGAHQLAAEKLSATGVQDALERSYAAADASRAGRALVAPLSVIVLGSHKLHGHSMTRYTRLLVDGYRRTGTRVQVLTPFSWLSTRVPAGPLRKLLVYIENLVLFPLRLLFLRDRTRPVHIADHSDSLWLCVPWLPVKSLVTCHDLIAVRAALGELPEHRTRTTGRAYQFLVRAGMRRATRILPVSYATEGDVRRLVAKVPTATVHNPLAPEMDPAESAPQPSPASAPYLLVVSSVGWRKRREHAVEVWRRLAEKSLGTLDLVVVGPELSRDELERGSSVPNGSVRVFQNLDDAQLMSLYREARAVVQVSRYEGFGWPVLEANIHGTPAICADLPVLREIGPDNIFIADDLDAVNWMDVSEMLDDAQVTAAVSARASGFRMLHFAERLDAQLAEVVNADG